MSLQSGELGENYETTGYGSRVGFGNKPALIIIDLCAAYFREGSPLYHSSYETIIAPLLRVRDAAHQANIPVILTRVEYAKGGRDGGIFFIKSRIPLTCLEEGNALADFHPKINVRPNETVLTKKYPSAFFACPLAPMLIALGVDTVLLSGVSTSGCVRATAVDACSSGFRTMVVREAVGDRHPGPHEANLFDINAKYGDVVTEAETIEYLSGLTQKS